MKTIEHDFNTMYESLGDTRKNLLNNQVYENIKSLDDLKIFMEYHIFAVWDFMSLLKSLQILLTCTTIPWIPSKNPNISRLINEIVVAEESDEDSPNQYISHFELYHKSMKQTGANTEKIDKLINLIKSGKSLESALSEVEIPKFVIDFIRTTFDFIQTGKPHIIASAFTFGREEVIPEMFHSFLKDLSLHEPEKISIFYNYLERHIHLDAEEHTPLAFKMISELCGNDEKKWEEVQQAAIDALNARINLWNGISEIIKNNKNP